MGPNKFNFFLLELIDVMRELKAVKEERSSGLVVMIQVESSKKKKVEQNEIITFNSHGMSVIMAEIGLCSNKSSRSTRIQPKLSKSGQRFGLKQTKLKNYMG